MTLEKMAEILEEQGCDQVVIRDDEVWCCCPLHDESSPSFSVNVDKGVYNCFVCGGGPLIRLLDRWGYDTRTLRYAGIETLASRIDALRHGPAPVFVRQASSGKDPPYGRVSDSAVQYLNSRGFGPEQVPELIRAWDLWSSRSRGRELLHFPVRDVNMGRVLFEATRDLARKEYRYTKGAKKSAVLYGWHLVPFFCVSRRVPLSVVVVEGIFDALKIWSFGFNAAALLGARPSARQLEILTRADEVVWALDNDIAGMAGTSEGFRALRGAGVKQTALYLGPCKDPGDIPDRSAFLKMMSLSLSRGDEIAYPGSRSLCRRLDKVRRSARV